MNFQTSCMVLATNEQQQIKLQEWMAGIGWRVLGGRDGKHNFLVADTDQNAALWMKLDESARECFGNDFYDCGENIEIFKALAAMNRDNDREQWFTNGSEWIKCPDDILTLQVVPSYALFHKATIEEIIEHFKVKAQ